MPQECVKYLYCKGRNSNGSNGEDSWSEIWSRESRISTSLLKLGEIQLGKNLGNISSATRGPQLNIQRVFEGPLPSSVSSLASSDLRRKINSWSVFTQMSWSEIPVVSIVIFKEKRQIGKNSSSFLWHLLYKKDSFFWIIKPYRL